MSETKHVYLLTSSRQLVFLLRTYLSVCDSNGTQRARFPFAFKGGGGGGVEFIPEILSLSL